jgi:hypothetical protein
LRNTDHISASAADDMMCLRTALMIKIAPLVSLLAMFLPMWKNHPALPLASLSEMYDASLLIFNFISDAW